MARKIIWNRRGQGMVEYALLVAGVALVAIVGVSMMGHKTADMVGTTASVLPGSHDDDNGPIQAGQLVETARGTDGNIQLDSAAVADPSRRLNGNLGFGDSGTQSSTGGTFVADGTPGVAAGN